MRMVRLHGSLRAGLLLVGLTLHDGAGVGERRAGGFELVAGDAHCVLSRAQCRVGRQVLHAGLVQGFAGDHALVLPRDRSAARELELQGREGLDGPVETTPEITVAAPGYRVDLVARHLGRDPLDGALYLFTNAKRTSANSSVSP